MAIQGRPQRVATTNNYLNPLDILKPERLRTLIHQHPGEVDTLQDLMDILGRSRAVERVEYSHDEKNWVTRTIGVNGNVGDPGAGNPTTWTIPANEHSWPNGTESYARVDDFVLFANGVQGIITAVNTGVANAHTVTATPLDSTDNIGALTAGDRVVVTTNGHLERTTQPQGRTPDKLKFTYYLQIIKENFEVSGTELNEMTWTTQKGPNGEVSDVWYLEGQMEAYQRFKRQIDMACLIGQGSATNVANLRVMTGLIPFIVSGGNEVNYTPGSFGLTDLDDMIDLLDAEKAMNREYWLLNGLPLNRQFDDFIANLLNNGGIVYGAFGGKSDIAVSLKFKSFHRSGYTFHNRMFSEFTNPEGLGAAGQAYPNYGLVIPTGSMVTGSGGKEYMLEKTYSAKRGYNRGWEHWVTGSAGPAGGKNATSLVDEAQFSWRAEVGMWPKAANMFGIFRP